MFPVVIFFLITELPCNRKDIEKTDAFCGGNMFLVPRFPFIRIPYNRIPLFLAKGSDKGDEEVQASI